MLWLGKSKGNWPFDLRTQAQLLVFQRICGELQTVEIQTSNTSRCSILGLPVEIIQHIANYLPLSSKAALSLSCKTIASITGTLSWKYLKCPQHVFDRHVFGRLLERDFEDAIYCYGCVKLHWTSLGGPKYLRQFYTVEQMSQKLSWATETDTGDVFGYLYDLMSRTSLTCGHIIKLCSWEYWSFWNPPQNPSLRSGSDFLHYDFRLLLAGSQLSDNSDEGLPYPFCQVTRISPTRYACRYAPRTIQYNGPQSPLLSSSSRAPCPPRETSCRPNNPLFSRLKSLSHQAMARWRAIGRIESEDQTVRQLRNSQKLRDRTMDMRIFRDQLWESDRKLWMQDMTFVLTFHDDQLFISDPLGAYYSFLFQLS